MTKLRWVWLVSLGLGLLAAGIVSTIALQNGTHATYCPAASRFWILTCVPTPQALGLALGFAVVMAIVVFPLAWIIANFRVR